MKELTVVIPNVNGLKFIKPCLDSLRQQTQKEFDIIVVDDGSTDAGPEIIESEYSEVKLIKHGENKGFCAAVNTGIKHTQTEFVLLLNNDTQVHQEFIAQMLKAAKNHDDMFACSAKMIQSHDREHLDDAGNLYNAFGWAYARGKGKPVDKYNKSAKIFAACAGAAIYKRKVFEEIGLFDEKHFAYLEDIDIGYRARIYGYNNYFEPSAIVYHLGSATSGSTYNDFKVSHSSRNNIYLIYKNMPIGQIVLNFLPLCIGFLIKLLFFYKKGFGKIYKDGIKAGFKLCDKENKIRFRVGNLGKYAKIQLELWFNIFRRC